MGDNFVLTRPMTPGSGSGSCRATCCPEIKQVGVFRTSVQQLALELRINDLIQNLHIEQRFLPFFSLSHITVQLAQVA